MIFDETLKDFDYQIALCGCELTEDVEWVASHYGQSAIIEGDDEQCD